MRLGLACGLSLALGCGPTIQLDDGTGGSSDEGTSTSGSPPPPGTTTEPPPPGTTTTTTTTTMPLPPADESSSETGVGFIEVPDTESPPTCDLFEPDCPRGEKCIPWATDGGGSWNSTRCSPVAEDPDAVGESCMVEGSPTSGIDTCEHGSMCWDVDPATLEGFCVAICVGSVEAPTCEDETATCAINGDLTIAVCLPGCDPLQQDCPGGQGCYPWNDRFTCALDDSGDMGVPGDPCPYLSACDPGAMCVTPGLVPDCMNAAGCCTAFCSLDDPMPPCLPGQVCTSWYEEGAAPPGYELVGVCVPPI